MPSANYGKRPEFATHIRGTFSLRGAAVTVIDLAVLFERSETSSDHTTVAVLELDGQWIGVTFSRTGKVFKGCDEEYSEFEPASRSPYVPGLFRLSGGERLVQVIDVEGLFHRTNVLKDMTQTRQSPETLKKRQRGQATKYIASHWATTNAPFPSRRFKRSFSFKSYQAHSSAAVRPVSGPLHCRDGTLPVFDMVPLIEGSSAPSDGSKYIGKNVVVMHYDSVLFGMVVDSVDEIFSAYPADLITFPSANLMREDTYAGSIVRKNLDQILVFNHESLLRNREISNVAGVHGNLTDTALRLRSGSEKEKPASARTYLTFRADATYAVELNEIREIIDLPDRLLRPPGLDSRFLGVYNLRSQVSIAIAELQPASLCGDLEIEGELRKVLIFDTKDGKAGLVVGSVESIVSVPDSERFSHRNHSRLIRSTELLRINSAAGRISYIPVVVLVDLLENMFGHNGTDPCESAFAEDVRSAADSKYPTPAT